MIKRPMLVERHRRPPRFGILAGMGRNPLALVEDADQTDQPVTSTFLPISR